MRRLMIALLAGAILLAVAGCQSNQQGGGGTGGGSSEQSGSIKPEAVFGLIGDWAQSSHAMPVSFAAEEDGCAGCHDGRAFAQGISDPRSLEASFGPFVTPTDCRACHNARTAQIFQSGEVTTPVNTQALKAGSGALCINCHRERSVPKVNDPDRRAPHYSMQAPILFGYGGVGPAMERSSSTTKHASIQNACVGCHMLKNDQGVASHTFAPAQPQDVCRKCHQGIDSYDPTARGDYDGDGSTEGFQTEVDGLLSLVASATVAQSNATTLTSESGRVILRSGETTIPAGRISDDVYTAAYNWLVVRNDKSRGIHNPRYTVTLLQETYRDLTGQPVPNASAFGAGKGAGSGGATGTPGTTETTP